MIRPQIFSSLFLTRTREPVILNATGAKDLLFDAHKTALLLGSAYPFARHAGNPPASGRTLVMPRRFSRSAARAAAASSGQLQ